MKRCLHTLLTLDFVTRSFWVLSEIRIPLGEMSVNSGLCCGYVLVITVVNDCSGHAAVNRFDHVEELSTRGQRGQFHDRPVSTSDKRRTLMGGDRQPLPVLQRHVSPAYLETRSSEPAFKSSGIADQSRYKGCPQYQHKADGYRAEYAGRRSARYLVSGLLQTIGNSCIAGSNE